MSHDVWCWRIPCSIAVKHFCHAKLRCKGSHESPSASVHTVCFRQQLFKPQVRFKEVLFWSDLNYFYGILRLNDSTWIQQMDCFITVMMWSGVMQNCRKYIKSRWWVDSLTIFKREKMVVNIQCLIIHNNSMLLYDMWQIQIEIFWINTLLPFDKCLQECSGWF